MGLEDFHLQAFREALLGTRFGVGLRHLYRQILRDCLGRGAYRQLFFDFSHHAFRNTGYRGQLNDFCERVYRFTVINDAGGQPLANAR